MELTRARILLEKFNEELAALEGSPLPPLDIEKVWIKGLYGGLRSISLILNDVVLAASGVDPDGSPSTEDGVDKTSDQPDGGGVLP